MISDAIHSVSDVFSTIIVIIGLRLSNKKADTEHPYGHERFECVSSLLLSFLLWWLAISLAQTAINNIYNKNYLTIVIPPFSTIVVAIISILTKELLFLYTLRISKKLNSLSLKADAWHHHSDGLSSIVSLIALIMARNGFPVFDDIGSIIICIFIFKVGYDVFKEAINGMLDVSCNKELEEKIKEVICNIDGVRNIDSLKTRLFSTKIYIDIEIAVDRTLLLSEAHKISEEVHDILEEEFPEIKHCMVHVNPY